MPRRTLPCLCFLVATLASAPTGADDVRRCVDAQGNAVYTDRPCEAVQAMPLDAPPDAAAGAHFTGGFAVRGCARRPGQLLDGVRSALEARDVNRLANWYHWTGTGSGTAKHLMDQLEGIANQPLVAIELVYPAEPGIEDGAGPGFPPSSSEAAPPPDQDPTPLAYNQAPAGGPNLAPFQEPGPPPADAPGPAVAGTADGATAVEASGTAGPASVPGPAPEGLRVQQVAGATDISSTSTQFRLVRNAGCWWIEL